MNQKKSLTIILTLILIFLIPCPVSAYLDPGFGSMVWQLLAAVVFSIVFSLKIFWINIKNFFSKTKDE